MEMTKRALVMGGTSGLGFEIAKRLTKDYEVIVSGRSVNFSQERVRHLDRIDLEKASSDFVLKYFLEQCPSVDLFVYAVGRRQAKGLGSGFYDRDDISGLVKIGITIPAMLISGLMWRDGGLSGLIVITSTSEWIPRLGEEVYCSTKAGLGRLADSLALNPRIDKTMVLAPSGMNTKFWAGDERDTSNYLDPGWVADQGLDQFNDDFKYKHVNVLREPPRVEVSERR